MLRTEQVRHNAAAFGGNRVLRLMCDECACVRYVGVQRGEAAPHVHHPSLDDIPWRRLHHPTVGYRALRAESTQEEGFGRA